MRTGTPPGLPGGPPQPSVMQSVRWLLGSTSMLDRSHQKYGDMFTLDLIGKAVAGPAADRGRARLVFLAHPDLVRQVFTADPAVMLTGVTNAFLAPLVGPRSILVMDEPGHAAQRKLLLPPLRSGHVRHFAELMSEVAEAELRRWPVGEPFTLWPRMQAITLEVIVRTVFGISEPRRLTFVTGLLGGMLNRMTSPPWLAAQALRASLTPGNAMTVAQRLITPVDKVIAEEIGARRAARDLDRRDDILSLLLRARHEDGSAMSDQELRDELMTLLIAGHESTATALAWAFERLLRHPGRLELLRQEADEGREEYASAVVKETLRLRPVLPFVLRRLARPMEIGGRLLPPGTLLAPCAYLIHRRPDIYPEPLRFLPERFIEQPAGSHTWMPFGGGVRRCLGANFAELEMRRVLQTVVSGADLVPADAGPEAIRSRFITIAPGRGARVVLKGRRTPVRPGKTVGETR